MIYHIYILNAALIHTAVCTYVHHTGQLCLETPKTYCSSTISNMALKSKTRLQMIAQKQLWHHMLFMYILTPVRPCLASCKWQISPFTMSWIIYMDRCRRRNSRLRDLGQWWLCVQMEGWAAGPLCGNDNLELGMLKRGRPISTQSSKRDSRGWTSCASSGT